MFGSEASSRHCLEVRQRRQPRPTKAHAPARDSQQPQPDPSGITHILQEHGVLRHTGDAERRGPAPCGDNERVVRNVIVLAQLLLWQQRDVCRVGFVALDLCVVGERGRGDGDCLVDEVCRALARCRVRPWAGKRLTPLARLTNTLGTRLRIIHPFDTPHRLGRAPELEGADGRRGEEGREGEVRVGGDDGDWALAVSAASRPRLERGRGAKQATGTSSRRARRVSPGDLLSRLLACGCTPPTVQLVEAANSPS